MGLEYSSFMVVHVVTIDMAGAYYWCTADDRGETTTLDDGGYYEKIASDGTPIVANGSGGWVGFTSSSTPEVCMSESPAACLFAVAHNISEATPLHVYRTMKDPDVHVMGGFDFGLLEEVRYRHPSDDPVPVEKHTTVDLPQRVFDDASETYNPHGPRNDPPEQRCVTLDASPVVHNWWGEAVKKALSDVLDDGDYPDPLTPDPPDLPY